MITKNDGMNEPLLKCIARVLLNQQFAAPGGTGSKANISLEFTLEK